MSHGVVLVFWAFVGAVVLFGAVATYTVRRETAAASRARPPSSTPLVHQVTWEQSPSGEMTWCSCLTCKWRAGEATGNDGRLGAALVSHLQRGSR